MGFKRTEANKLLVACHRRCCVCHRYCGIKIELHHIQPNEDGGDDSIENAIPLCFECHAEVQLYNDAHPRGRKFHPDELQDHKGQWLRIWGKRGQEKGVKSTIDPCKTKKNYGVTLNWRKKGSSLLWKKGSEKGVKSTIDPCKTKKNYGVTLNCELHSSLCTIQKTSGMPFTFTGTIYGTFSTFKLGTCGGTCGTSVKKQITIF